MVRARLHVICGNCGCDDEFTWEFAPVPKELCGIDGCEDDVYIKCKNCSTLHCPNHNATMNREITND